ncbi:MAG: Ig-like domain repeat protein [Chloroflexi bacterium]|nr:Ig-like domain repeat protein [Chloroflexota bacterium]
MKPLLARPRAKSLSIIIALLFLGIVLSSAALPVHAALSLSTTTPYTENFDSIGTSATATLPTDWRVSKDAINVRTVGLYASATTATERQGGNNMSTSASNGIYNFGAGAAATATDRAIGFLSSSSATKSGNLYAYFNNDTGAALSGVTLSYDVEKYRKGSNAAGFNVQLYYSLDGTSWTSAGPSFLTGFSADADNTGFASAPGVTQSITNQALNVPIPSGSDFYLAWNYSVTSGTITSNAQALAIDNFSILANADLVPTNPIGSGTANPSAVMAGDSTLLTVSVTPGTNPTSTGLGVTCDLTSIGGSNPTSFADAGSNSFTHTATISLGTSAGIKLLPCTITDAQSRTGNASISLNVTAIVPIGTVNGTISDTEDATTHRSTYAPASGNGPGSTVVTVRGVIYERTYQAISNSSNYYNGFFIQNTAATADTDPNTSDGLYVFMNTAGSLSGPSGVYTPTVGDEIVLSGSISEYYNMTEMQSPSLAVLQVIRTGVDLDAELTAFVANPPINSADANRYWERRQGMRGQVPANSIVLNGRNVYDPADSEIWLASSDSTIAGRSDPFTRRAFRDAHTLDDNYDANNWDGNGYRIVMGGWGVKYTQGDAQALLNPARTFATVTNAPIGGVNYSYGKYRLEVTIQPTLTNGVDPSTNSAPQAFDRNTGYSIVDYNLENLYDYRDNPFSGCDFATDTKCSKTGTPFQSDINPPFDYVPASDATYQARLTDMATQVINDLHSPDILMVQEVENQDICTVTGGALTCGTTNNADGKPDVLQELALKIATLGGAAYDAAWDRDSSDLRGIAPSFLYRTDRVQLLPATGDPVLGINPTIGSYVGVTNNADVSNPKTLNAILPGGVTACETSWIFPRAADVALFRIYQTSIGVGSYHDVYAINNHFKSGPDSCVAHRTEQAKYNAALVQYLQTANPNVRIVVAGDLNVYPRPDDPVAPPSTPTDQLGSLYAANLGLKNLWEVALAEHPEAAYSYVYLGQAQTLDQMFVNQSMLGNLQQFRIAHINSDFPADYTGDVARGTSDHDPNVAVFNFKLDTTHTLTSSQNPSILGQSVTFTAQVTSTGPITPTGTVTFTVDSDAPFAQTLVNGATAFSTSSLSIGTHIITATYGGDTNYNGSAKSGAQNVGYAMPTITSMNPTSAPVNAPTFTLVVTGTGFASGASVIRWNGIDHATSFVSSTQLTTTIQKSELTSTGNVTVTVFNPTPGGGQATPPRTFTIGQGDTQLTLTSSGSPSMWQQNVVFTATLTQTFGTRRPRDIAPSGIVTFTDSTTGGVVCGNVAMYNWQALCNTAALTVGTHSLIATFSGDANYVASTSNTLGHTVNKADTWVVLNTSLNPSIVGTTVTFTATVLPTFPKPQVKSPSGGQCSIGGTVQFKDGTTNLVIPLSLDSVYCRATFTTNALSVGTHPITAVYSGDTNYTGSTSNQVDQVVNNAKLFLPLITKNFVDAPNLVVDNLIVSTNDIQVVIKNTGTTPVINEFWVDVYINPNTAPTSVNQTWNMLGSQGLVWGVTSSALPINPGETRTLSIANDPNHYFWSSLSNFTLPIQNATIYVQVDSSNAGVWYGAVQENHEVAGTTYDNIRKFTVMSGVVSLPIKSLRDPVTRSKLPNRP